MSSRSHASEHELAVQALSRVANTSRVLVGGLGLGFTLRAVLDRVAPTTRVTVAELVPELVKWNEEHVGMLADHPLRDPRCEVIVGDVFEVIRQAPHGFDAVLLDVDNGPVAVSHDKNKRLYTSHGIAACRRALRPGGVLALWSAGADARYQRDLQRARFTVEVAKVAATNSGRAKHVIFVATAS
jgi:spermidine synthase